MALSVTLALCPACQFLSTESQPPMDFIQFQALPQYRQAGLTIILALGTPGFEIQEQPGQSRIVEGVAIAIIQIAFRPGTF